jgi:hypothetical protein
VYVAQFKILPMKKLVLCYLLGILIIPIAERIIFGQLRGGLHPGVFIHTGVLALLIVNFHATRIKKNTISYMIFGFTLVYAINLLVVETLLFPSLSSIPSIVFSLKNFLLLHLSYYIYINANYFLKYLDRIMLVNVCVILANIIIGYYFQIGWQSYGAVGLADSYRGFLAGNDTSIFAFIAFGYTLFSFSVTNTRGKNILIAILFVLSVCSMVIIATKAIFVAAIIMAFYVLDRRVTFRKVSLIGALCLIIAVFFLKGSLEDRMMGNYISQLNQNTKLLETFSVLPSSISWISVIAPGRILIGLMLIYQQISDSWITLLFGYGVAGIYEAFGRPPMMHIFSVMGHYGLFGFLVFYFPQLILALRVLKKRVFTRTNVLFLSVFIYGSLGGFVYGNASTSVMFALLFSLTFYQSQYGRLEEF